MIRIVTFASVLCVFVLLGPATARAQLDKKPRGSSSFREALEKRKKMRESIDEDNKYLAKLKLRLAEGKEFVKEHKDMPKEVLDTSKAINKLIQYQIEFAEEKIAAGEEFGEKEYEAASKVIEREKKAKFDRLRKNIDDNRVKSLEEMNKKYQSQMEDINRQFRESTDRSQKQYQTTVDAANLKFKFQTNAGKIGLVIWNLPPDQKLHRRYTTAVNIRLMKGDEIVWKAKNYKLHRKEAANPIRLPNVMFNKVLIEVTKWKGEGGGLAEVQVYCGEENVAFRRPCQVTNSETLPMHLDDQNAFTDGVTIPTVEGEGYWIPEAKTKATLMVDLLGPLVEAEGDEKVR